LRLAHAELATAPVLGIAGLGLGVLDDARVAGHLRVGLRRDTGVPAAALQLPGSAGKARCTAPVWVLGQRVVMALLRV
jgi:hypothetical protein